MTFEEAIENNLPRLVVLYRNEGKGEEFQWGVVGDIPVLNLIGSIVAAQTMLMDTTLDECPQQAFVMTVENIMTNYYVHRDIPAIPLIGMLEMIKATLTSGNLSKMVPNQSKILGPDGGPINRVRGM